LISSTIHSIECFPGNEKEASYVKPNTKNCTQDSTMQELKHNFHDE